jgi:hypothetical protein
VRAYGVAFVGVLLLSAALGGFRAGVGLVLTTLLVYGFVPSFAAFGRVLAERRNTPRARASARPGTPLAATGPLDADENTSD